MMMRVLLVLMMMAMMMIDRHGDGDGGAVAFDGLMREGDDLACLAGYTYWTCPENRVLPSRLVS